VQAFPDAAAGVPLYDSAQKEAVDECIAIGTQPFCTPGGHTVDVAHLASPRDRRRIRGGCYCRLG
jgi:hypothetical protein